MHGVHPGTSLRVARTLHTKTESATASLSRFIVNALRLNCLAAAAGFRKRRQKASVVGTTLSHFVQPIDPSIVWDHAHEIAKS